jgi:hypothetical protein
MHGFLRLRRLTLSQIVGLLLALVLVERAMLVRAAFGPLLGIQTQGVLLVIVWCWVVLLLGTILGLLRKRRWGIYLLIALVPISTILLSVPLIPFLTLLAPKPYRPYAMILVNVLLLLGTLYLLRSTRSSGQGVLAAD